MTSDFIQQQLSSRDILPRALREGAVRPVKYPELLRQLQSQHELERDGLNRTLGAAMSILNKAHAMLERAEARLLERDDRIQSLQAMARLDELTGLMNRAGFFEAFLRELGRTHRLASRGGILILIDIDNFRSVNKLYGHEAGDNCLRIVAETLKHEIRSMDFGARIGADEFVLLFSDTDSKAAMERVQLLALRLNNLSYIWHGAEICISASIGLKTYGQGDRAEDIFRAADRRLEQARRSKKDLDDA